MNTTKFVSRLIAVAFLVTGWSLAQAADRTVDTVTDKVADTVADQVADTVAAKATDKATAKAAKAAKAGAAGPIRLAQTAATPPPAGAPPVASAAESDEGLQTVTVSASAITLSGYEQPTPVQTIGVEQLQSAAKLDVTDALRDMPAFTGSPSPQNTRNSDSISTGVAALNQVDLRGLGINRTLVLIDGQRVVYGSLYGGVDTVNIPTPLVSRVDVVTGGASAIWGSDAVAGVVNYVMNHKFNGVEVNVTNSNNWHNEHEQLRADLTVGTGFAGDRGHIEASFSYLQVPDPFFMYQMEGGAGRQRLLQNPACVGSTAANGGVRNFYGFYCPPGQVWLQPFNDVGHPKATPGGIITGCLNAAGGTIPGCGLLNTYFVGPNAQALVFNPGVVSQSYQAGGTLNNLTNYFPIQGAPQKNKTAFVLGTFKINDHLEVTAQFNWGYNAFFQDSYFGNQFGNAPIHTGNPFIPADTQAQMTALGVDTIQVGTFNSNPLTGPIDRLQDLVGTVGGTALFETRRLTRGVLGLNGDFGESWSWNAYYQRSETRQFEAGLNNFLVQTRTNAEDAVRVGSFNSRYTAGAYPNPLNLPVGAITCLSNLLPATAAGRTTDCAPLNIFGSGPGVASQAAIDYLQATAHAGGNTNTTFLTEDVAAATLQGKLPFGLPAGQVAMAAGVVYRKEVGLKTNCGFNCDNVKFPLGNFANFDAGYNTKEGSIEFNAPILKDSFVQDLSVDAAYRGIQYSTSGFVSTYKFGVLSQVNDVVRVRASYSRDIRAGNLSELFGQPATDGSTGVDPRTGLVTADFTIHAGNENVQPETAETRTFGIVLTPIQGLFASIDWYSIRIKDVINGGLSQTAIVNGCLAGNSQYCEFIYYGTFPSSGGCSSPTPTGCPLSLPLFGVVSAAVNSDSQETAGLDFVADYRTPFMGGYINVSGAANYVFNMRYTTLGQTCDPMNGLSNSQGSYGGCNITGYPKFKGNVGVTYAQDGWTGTVQSRLIGAAHLVSNWDSGVQVADNDIPFYAYLDLRLSYAFERGLTIYTAVDNALDKTVPPTPANAYRGSTLFDPDTRDDVYDGYGRVWRLGVRLRF